MRGVLAGAVLWACPWTVACGAGTPFEPGLSSLLRVQGAQFVDGPMPDPASAAPHVDSLAFPTNTIWPSEIDKAFSGSLDPSATAVAVALSGDRGYWIVTAGVPDVSAPTLPTFRSTASFSPALAPGQYTFEARAVDSSGHFGLPATQTLTAIGAPPSAPAPIGDLVVTLTWDSESDLDLHVVDPLGNEIYYGDPSSAPFGVAQADADAGSYGTLDFDSNAGCVIDGLRREDVVWPGPPPTGSYQVRVDTPSLCGQPIANFNVIATLYGSLIGQASGVALDSSTWGAHGRGAGTLVLTFEVP